MIRLHKSMVPEDLNIKNILKTKMVSNSKNVIKLEQQLEKIHNVRNAICFNSCTTAMLVTFYVLQPKNIVMPSFTWISDKTILDMLNIKTTFMKQIEPDTLLTPIKEQRKHIDNCDYLFITATFGNKPYVIDKNKTIIDSSHCAGHPGFGNLGYVEFLSFSPMKTITGIEGGAVLTNDDSLAIRIKGFQSYIGRMGEINAKVALYNLRRRNKIFHWKNKVFNEYKRAFGSGRLQKINEYSTLNEIVLNISYYQDKFLELIDKIEIRQRYNPNDVYWSFKEGALIGYLELNSSSVDAFHNHIVLPSYLGCDYKKVIKTIKKIEQGK